MPNPHICQFAPGNRMEGAAIARACWDQHVSWRTLDTRKVNMADLGSREVRVSQLGKPGFCFRFLMLFGLKYAKKTHHLYHLGSSGIGCPKGAPTNLCFILIGPLETATGGISKFQTSPYPICLVGGAITILKNHGVRQWVSDDIPYMKWKKKQYLKPPTSYKHL